MTTTELSSQRIDQRTNIWSERPDRAPTGARGSAGGRDPRDRYPRRHGPSPGGDGLHRSAGGPPPETSKHCMEVDP